MAFTVDPRYNAAYAAATRGLPSAEPLPAGDIEGRRAALSAIAHRFSSLHPRPVDTLSEDFYAVAADGSSMLLRWYTKRGVKPGPAVLYVHGGGMFLGSVDLYDGLVSNYVSLSEVSMLSVEYRLAPEHPFPAAIEDVYAALLWLSGHAAELKIDVTRLAVMGDSAGGGLAAAVALLARDRNGPALACQILVCPMLDDRTPRPTAELAPFLTWTYDDNLTAWSAALGEPHRSDVPQYAAPARASELTGLPSSYVEVGQLDLFRDECLAFVQRLCAAGIDVEFHLRPGLPHDFDTFTWGAEPTQHAVLDRVRRLRLL